LLPGANETRELALSSIDAWHVPYGSLSFNLDALSAFFLTLILLLGVLTAVFGKNSSGTTWFFFISLMFGMTLVVLAANALLFLFGWEIMSLASYFLVTTRHQEPGVRAAGWTYLVATHLGTIFLFVMFFLCEQKTGSFDFHAFSSLSAQSPEVLAAIFACAVIGFGTKAGFAPFHVWLPDTYPETPSHVAALMSAVMAKIAIYGLLRMLTFLGEPEAWWGITLIAIGIMSGLSGIIMALSQKDLKRLIAYSSIENIGIITIGIGLGLLGMAYQATGFAVLGFAGALLHILNHALFKGLLFLAAGSVLQATKTRLIDDLGGLLRRMPITGGLFLFGSIAITALPPLNGFISEFLIYLSALGGGLTLRFPANLPFLAAVLGLALIGGLALAAFAKAFGLVFLGRARSEHSTRASESGIWMLLPMVVLALCCVAIAFGSGFFLEEFAPIVGVLLPHHSAATEMTLQAVAGQAFAIAMLSGIFLAVLGILALFRYLLLRGRVVQTGVTWGCGYTKGTPKMQYTSTSFSEPLSLLFSPLAAMKTEVTAPSGFFPSAASLQRHVTDTFRESIYLPIFLRISALFSHFRLIQHGRLRLYVLNVVVTLLVLLTWKIGFSS